MEKKIGTMGWMQFKVVPRTKLSTLKLINIENIATLQQFN